MDDNRIKQVNPSLARLKYDPNRKNNSEKKKKHQPKKLHEPDNSNENGFDDFA
ncbi:MAG: hypothetical protein AB8B89_08855 [Gammaproteobacteria bacterium]